MATALPAASTRGAAEVRVLAMKTAGAEELGRDVDGAPLAPPIDSVLAAQLEVAASNASMGQRAEAGARLRLLKRPILRVAQLFSREQVTFNQSIIGAVRSLAERLSGQGHLLAKAEDSLQAVQGSVASMEGSSRETATRLGQLGDALGRLEREQEALAANARESTAQLALLRSLLEGMARRAQQGPAIPPPPSSTPESSERAGEQRSAPQVDQFYVDFEQRFRGAQDDIRRRQEDYLPEMADLPGAGARVLDIGSGRGEWLSLLRDRGIAAYGVEINELFVLMGRDAGLDVRAEEAIAHLRSLDESSLAAVTAFQLAEHLEFATLLELIDHSFRALVPGGLLLLETPNPGNLLVSTLTFWMDPSHRHPLPPDLLQFCLHHRGFRQVEKRFAQALPEQWFTYPAPEDPAQVATHRVIQYINDAFFGPQDYAIIGRKPTISRTDPAQ